VAEAVLSAPRVDLRYRWPALAPQVAFLLGSTVVQAVIPALARALPI
jgi:hypothetical protein